jgi:hypothetical protein
MKWAYDLTGAEPIIKDVAVYDATTIQDGELLQLGLAAAGFYTAGTGHGYASACPTTVGATQGVDALGISLETKTTADTPSIAALHNLTTGAFCYVKAVVNPFAVYRAWVNTGTAGTEADCKITVAAGATALTQFVIGALGTTGVHNSSWCYFSASAGANFGQLRKVASSEVAGSSTDTVVLDSSMLSATSSDKVTFIANPGQNPYPLNADAVNVGCSSVDAYTATKFRVVDNLVDFGNGVELLRENKHAGGKINLGTAAAKAVRFYQDLVMKDHIFGTD